MALRRLLYLLTAALPAIVGAPAANSAQAAGTAPVNPYNGLQEREEVYEFTQKPRVEKKGGAWVITFATTAACDATVAVVAPGGKIVRHLASGVLGRNAPWPFRQNSLRQRLEWDGLTDDFKKAPPGCKVRVSLGLKARCDKSIAYDPYLLPDGKGRNKLLVGRSADGKIHVISETQGSVVGRVFSKEGKYLRTFIPVPADHVETAAAAMGLKLGTTKWGDRVLVCGWFGPYSQLGGSWKTGLDKALPKLAPGVKFAPQPRPKEIPAASAAGAGAGIVGVKFVHLAADRARDEVYVGTGGQYRFFGRTGELDETWFPKGGLGKGSPSCEVCVGAGGLIYLRFGQHCYGRHMIRLDHEGRLVPFKKEHTVRVPGGDGWWTRLPEAFKGGVDAVFCGVRGHSNTFTHGLYASPGGRLIVGGIQEIDAKWAVRRGIVKEAKGPEIKGTYVIAWDADGKLITADAVGNTRHGHGLTVDRDGNIYAVIAGVMPAGQKTLEGSDIPADFRKQGGYASLVKFRGRGGKYPLGQVTDGTDAPAGVVKLTTRRVGPPKEPGYAAGALWAYGGIVGQSAGDCRCNHTRHDMDFFARSWIPANQCFSVMVLDANGNRIARLGRYGNVDDTETDRRQNRGDGICLAWPRAVAVSDKALYVADTANRRVLRAVLSYEVEQTVTLP